MAPIGARILPRGRVFPHFDDLVEDVLCRNGGNGDGSAQHALIARQAGKLAHNRDFVVLQHAHGFYARRVGHIEHLIHVAVFRNAVDRGFDALGNLDHDAVELHRLADVRLGRAGIGRIVVKENVAFDDLRGRAGQRRVHLRPPVR